MSMPRLLLKFLAAACIVVAMISAAAADDMGTVAVDVLTYVLGPGDVIAVEVVGEPDMSGDKRVGADGSIELPYAGKVVVGGLTLDVATKLLTARLAEKVLVNPQVLVNLKMAVSKRVEVSGGVTKPGMITLERGRTTVSDLIVLAGGLADPSTSRAEIWRDTENGRIIIPIDLEAIGRGGLAADVEILPGDHFEVPQAQQVFVDGQVEKPAGYSYREGMTLTQAIANAGGATGTARLTAVQIRRGSEQQVVNVKRVMRGAEADFMLRPGDQIYVPESVF